MLLSISGAIKMEKGKYWVQHFFMVGRTLLAWKFLIRNKNKTGQISGTTMHTPYHKGVQCHTVNSLSDKQHASFTFKGNKNRKGQTLGSMSDNSTKNCDAKAKTNTKGSPQDEPPSFCPQSKSLP